MVVSVASFPEREFYPESCAGRPAAGKSAVLTCVSFVPGSSTYPQAVDLSQTGPADSRYILRHCGASAFGGARPVPPVAFRTAGWRYVMGEGNA